MSNSNISRSVIAFLLSAAFLPGLSAYGQAPLERGYEPFPQSGTFDDPQIENLPIQFSEFVSDEPPEELPGQPQRENGDEPQDEQDEQEESVDERLDRLERLVGGVQETERSFLEAMSSDSERFVNGRLHIDFWSFPGSSAGINIIESGTPGGTPQDRLLYRRIRLGVNGPLPAGNMSYRLEIEFSGQDGSQFRDAWIGWDDLVFFQTIRLGNQKRPYGLDHLNSSNLNVFVERPFIVDGLNEDNRRFGMVAYGVSPAQKFNWRYGFYNLSPVQDVGSIIGDNFQMELAGRLANTWWYDEGSEGRGYGHWAISGTVASPARTTANQLNAARFRTFPEGRSTGRWLSTRVITGANAYQILAAESVFNAGRFQLTGELMNLWVQRSAMAGSDLYMHGGYFYLSYMLTGEHMPWNRNLGILGRLEPFENFFFVDTCKGGRGRGIGAWQIAMRMSYADFNDDDIFGGIGQSTTLALNWFWNAHARMQFNYIYGRVDDRLADLSGGGTAIVSGAYQIAGLRFMIDF